MQKYARFMLVFAHKRAYYVYCGRGGRIRTYGVTESESVALPLGDTPMRD